MYVYYAAMFILNFYAQRLMMFQTGRNTQLTSKHTVVSDGIWLFIEYHKHKIKYCSVLIRIGTAHLHQK